MLNRFQGWRERGWSVVDAGTYADAWQRFGGSVATHPLVVERLAQLAGIPVRYLAGEQGGELKAAIPTWGRDLALSKDVLKRHGKKGLFDLGNAELILPAAADAAAPLRHRGRYLSQLCEGRFSTLKPQAEQLAMARTPEELSKKFRYNQRMYSHFMQQEMPAEQRGIFIAGDDVSWTPAWVEGAVQTSLNAVWGIMTHFGGSTHAENPGPGDVFHEIGPIALPD